MSTQAAILILSAAAMWLVSGRSAHARYGWALGLASQPFWLYATYTADQWGMFALSIYYTGVWARGWINHRRPAAAIHRRPQTSMRALNGCRRDTTQPMATVRAAA